MEDKIQKITNAILELGEKAKEIMRVSMTENGVNESPRAGGKNTLINSNAFNDIQATQNDIDLITISFVYYFDYIDGNGYPYGRRPGVKPPPFKAIADWCKEKGITDDNSVIWAIINGIAKNGIKARPLIPDFEEMLDEYYETWADEVEKILLEETDEYFSER